MKKKILIIAVIIFGIGILGTAAFFTYSNFNASKADVIPPLFDNIPVAEQLPETTLTVYFQAHDNDDLKQVLAEIEKQTKNILNVKLDFKSVSTDAPGFGGNNSNDYYESIESMIKSGAPCDAYAYYDDSFSTWSLDILSRKGLAMDLSQKASDLMPDYFKQFSAEDLKCATIKGKLYAIPSNLPYTQRICALVRDDLMQKYKIPEIKNYDDYTNYMDIIKKNEPTLTPTIMYGTTMGLFAESYGYVILDYVPGLIYRWDDPTCRLTTWDQTPEFKKSIERLSDWTKKGFFLKKLQISTIDERTVTSGRWASIIAPSGTENEYNALLKAKGVTNWRYVAYPLYPDKVSEKLSLLTSGGGFVINPESKNADKFLALLNWLEKNQANYDLIRYGIKDKNYELYGDQVNLPAGFSTSKQYINWEGRNSFQNLTFERSEVSSPADTIKSYNLLLSKSKYAPLLGFKPDYSTIQSTWISRIRSAATLEQRLINGGDTSTIDEYVNSQKSNANELVFEIQKQVDKWMADNPAQ